MFFRYLGISIVKWIAVYTAILVFTMYVAPSWLRGNWLAIPIWIMVSAISYGFATWAMHIRIPTKNDLILLITVWMVVTICIEVFLETMAYGQPYFLLHDYQNYVQYLFEIVAILYAARVLRKKKMKKAGGEGLAV